MNRNVFQKKSGFTLVEIMVAISVFMVIVAGVMPMYVQSMRSSLLSQAKMDVNDSNRRISDQLAKYARDADGFLLFLSYEDGSVDIGGGMMVIRDLRNTTGGARLGPGNTGKMVVFLYYGEDPVPADSIPPPLERMVGFYLSAEHSDAEGDLFMFERSGAQIDQATAIEASLPPRSAMGTSAHKLILRDLTGLMDDGIFYNFDGRSVVMNAKLEQHVGALKATASYHLTITPRG